MFKCNFKKALIGLIAGLISGIFASGGGLFLVPAYLYLFNSSDKESKAATIACILPMSLVSTLIYGFKNIENYQVALVCVSGSVLGSFIGAKLLNKLNSNILKISFIIFLFYCGIKFFFN